MKTLDIKELQNRLDAISEAETIDINGMDFDQEDFNLAHAVDILTDKLIDQYKNFNRDNLDALPNEPEAYAASDYYGYPDYEEVAMIGYSELDAIDKRNFMKDYKEPPVVNPDAIKDAEAIFGIYKKQSEQREQVESVEKVNEYKITTRDGMEFDQEAFNLAHAVDTLTDKLVDQFNLTNDFDDTVGYAASDYYGYPDLEEVGMPMYYDLEDDEKEEFLKGYKEPPVVNPDAIKDAEAIMGDKTESVQEGDAELEELKSALGRTGGVMGFKN